jgi:hypothetical protein
MFLYQNKLENFVKLNYSCISRVFLKTKLLLMFTHYVTLFKKQNLPPTLEILPFF